MNKRYSVLAGIFVGLAACHSSPDADIVALAVSVAEASERDVSKVCGCEDLKCAQKAHGEFQRSEMDTLSRLSSAGAGPGALTTGKVEDAMTRYQAAKRRSGACMDKLKSAQRERAVASAKVGEWASSAIAALQQVDALCPETCEKAKVLFHPKVAATLITQAADITSERIAQLGRLEPAMLSDTPDSQIALALALDPKECVRLGSDRAKVVACSYRNASGDSVLGLIHAEGISSL